MYYYLDSFCDEYRKSIQEDSDFDLKHYEFILELVSRIKTFTRNSEEPKHNLNDGFLLTKRVLDDDNFETTEEKMILVQENQ